jgi:hypothetical protein
MTTISPAPGRSGGEDRPATAIGWKPAPSDQQGDAGDVRRIPGPTPSRQAGKAWLDPPSPGRVRGPRPPRAGAGTPPDASKTTLAPGMSVSSKGSQPPIELTDRCPTPHTDQFRRSDGRLITRDMPCRRKSCPACGPRLARERAAEWAHAMASDQVYRLVVAEGEPARMRRRKDYRHSQLAHLPAPDGRRVVYSTAPIGNHVEARDLLEILARDFAVMPNDGRRYSKLSAGWAAVAADAQAEREAAREPWEWLGRVGRSLGRVAMVAQDLGKLVGRTDDMVVVEAMPLAELARFLHLIRCRGPWQQWGEAKAA